MEFQARNRFLLMAYNESVMRELGRVVANHDRLPAAGVYEVYGQLMSRALGKPARPTASVNVLQHSGPALADHRALRSLSRRDGGASGCILQRGL